MAILVTGAVGFVGGNIARELASRGHDVIAVDIVPPDGLVQSFMEPVERKITFLIGDVVRPEFIEEISGYCDITRIVHAAAYTGYGNIERLNGKRLSEANVNGTLNILELGRRLEVARVIYVSTAAAYRGATPANSRFHEDTQLDVSRWPYTDPYGFYTITKVTGELIARRYGYLHDMDVAAVRLSQNFGPLERVTPYHTRISLPGQWTRWAARGETIEPSVQGTGIADVRKFGDDNIYVRDTADAIHTLLEAGELPHDLYNISSNKPLLLDEMIPAMRRAHPSVKIQEPPPNPAGAPQGRVILDNSRIEEDLGWCPRYDIYSSLQDFMDWRLEIGCSD